MVEVKDRKISKGLERFSELKQCAATNQKGRRCGHYALDPYDYCFYHLPHPIRKKIFDKPMSKKEMVGVLQHELRRLRRYEKNPSRRSQEVRRVIALICELQGEKVSSQEEKIDGEKALEKIINKWKKQKEDDQPSPTS